MKSVTFDDQRQVMDAEFLAHLRLPGTAGKQLVAAQSNGDAAAVMAVVARHFRTRNIPSWAFYVHGTAWLEIDGRGDVLAKAKDLLRQRFRNSWPTFATINLQTKGAHPDWEKGMGTMSTSLGRNTFISELTTAFALTGDAAYIAKARDLMYSFTAAYPFILEDGFEEDHDRHFGGTNNETLTVTYRCLRWIDLMYSGALHTSNIFSDGDVFWLVKQLWFYATQFYRFCDDRMRRDNHHLVDHGHLPFIMGTVFPEFTISDALYKQGQKTIVWHYTQNLFADGAYAEHSTKYQYHVMYHFLHPLAVAQANGIRLFSKTQIERLRQWVEFNLRACKPDGILSEFGDEFGGSLAYLCDSLAAPVMTPQLAAMAGAFKYTTGKSVSGTPAQLARVFRGWRAGQALCIGLSDYYTRQDVPRRPSRKALSAVASAQYPHGGYTFFRSDWAPTADFLAVSHNTNSLPHSHTHWDMMSFVLHTQGQTLIGDPATHLYDDQRIWTGQRAQEYRGYLYSVDSHNCLVMNDDTLKPIAACGHGCFWGGYPPKHDLGLFRAGGAIEVAEMWHDAYAPTRHRRFVIHVLGIGFVFVDLLAEPEESLRPNQYAQRFHFEGDVIIAPKSPDPGGSLRATLGDASCLIVPGGEAETIWRIWRDKRLAKLPGVGNGKDARGSWVAELSRRQQGQCVFTTFLLTADLASLVAPPTARYLGERSAQAAYPQHDGVSANALDLGSHGTLLLASCPYGKSLASTEMTTDGELAVATLDSRGRLRSWCLVRGSQLSIRNRKVVAGRKREWRAS